MFVSVHPTEARQVQGEVCKVEGCDTAPAAQIAYNLHGRSGTELVCTVHVLAATAQATSVLVFGRING